MGGGSAVRIAIVIVTTSSSRFTGTGCKQKHNK